MNDLLRKYFGFIAISLSLVLFALFLQLELNKKIWLDEFDSLLQIDVCSMNQLVSNYYYGSDTNPPLYFVLLWLTKQTFGEHILAFRILSVLFTTLALLVFFLILNEINFKKSITWGMLISLSSAFLVDFIVSEIRPYSLYFFTTFLILYFRLLFYKKASCLKGIFYTISLIFFLFSHYYALIYFLLIVFLECIFILKNKFRWYNILPYFISIAVFFIWVPAIFNQFHSFGKVIYHSYPRLSQFLLLPFEFFRYFSLAILLFISFLFLSKSKNLIKSNLVFLSINFVFLLAPLVIYLFSFFNNPVFAERYFIPTFIAYLILGTIGLTKMLDKYDNIKLKYIILTIFVVYCSQRYYKITNVYKAVNTVIERNLSLLDTAIVVCESPHVFAPLYFYSDNYNKSNLYLVFSKKADSLSKNNNQNLFDYRWYMNKRNTGQLKNVYEWNDFKKKVNCFYLINQQDRKLYEVEIKNSSDFNSSVVRDSLIFVKKYKL